MEKVQWNSIDEKQNGLKYSKSANHPPSLASVCLINMMQTHISQNLKRNKTIISEVLHRMNKMSPRTALWYHSYLENWNTSKTNFSILMPFGLSGVTVQPVASQHGIFFLAMWWRMPASYSLWQTRNIVKYAACAQGMGTKFVDIVSADVHGEGNLLHVYYVSHLETNLLTVSNESLKINQYCIHFY